VDSLMRSERGKIFGMSDRYLAAINPFVMSTSKYTSGLIAVLGFNMSAASS
jgi:hypothetical protein